MPAVSLPPKENALFKRILVSVRLRASSAEDLAASQACHPLPPPGGHRATLPGPRLLGTSEAERAPSSPPRGSHSDPRAWSSGCLLPSPRPRGPGSGLGPDLPGCQTASFRSP